MNWRVKLNGVDITAYCSGVQTRFEAENLCGEVEVALASRAPLAGLVVPRVPQSLSITVEEYVGGAWLSRGEYFLEQIEYPQDLEAKTASIWGRSWTARLTAPWAQKISKQWPGGETVGSIMAEVASMCGVTISVSNDYDVCQYCYAVSDQTPAEIIRDLATRSGQVLWPEIDGTLTVAPRLYRSLPSPAVTLDAADIVIESVDRQVPDFGNRILVSGDASVAGLSVQVVPLVDDTECVAADGQSTVRLIAIVIGADGDPVALGTVVTWSASSGLMQAATSTTQEVVRQAEQQRATSYRSLTLDLPAVSVIGVYARRDVNRRRNLYTERGGSVSGRVITFSLPLDYYDQAVFIDYVVQGAPNTWIAGWVPGEVSVLASVAGAQGFCTLHQSNPTACATQITMESSPASPCLGDTVSILLKTTMFGGAGVGAATFGIQGCGSLSSTRKLLTPRTITETLRTSIWGGAAEVRLSAIPTPGSAISVVLTEAPGGNLYASHNGQVVILNNSAILPGTQVTVTYTAGGTALVAWTPTALPAGYESITEMLPVIHTGAAPDTVAQVALTRTPVAAPLCVPTMEIGDFYASHTDKTVTLLEDDGVILPIGTQVQCSYQSVWLTQPGCNATITVRVDDGSEDGGRAQLAVSARDCRTVNPSGPGGTYDPEDPDQIPDETPGPGEQDEHDPTEWLEPEEPDLSPTSCTSEAINARTPTITADNHADVFVGECPGTCTCDELCASLRSTGRLSTEGGMTWAMCMEACAQAREDKCTQCVLDGPETLSPGVEGTWTDGKGNNGHFIGGALTLTERTPSGGYKAVMPTGGAGPFTIRVCYGETEESCCEAQVDFPPCTLSGLTTLSPGAESIYMPSAGMTGAVCTTGGDMEFVRLGAYGVGFVCRMKVGGCEGTVTVTYGGRVCGTLTVKNPKQDYVGSVVGPSLLAAGETAIYYHNLGAGATYTGTLSGTPFENELGNGVVCTMPANANMGQQFFVKFAGPCKSFAEMPVSMIGENCSGGIPIGIGAFPGPGAYVQDHSWPTQSNVIGLIGEYVFTNSPVSSGGYEGRWGRRVTGGISYYYVNGPLAQGQSSAWITHNYVRTEICNVP